MEGLEQRRLLTADVPMNRSEFVVRTQVTPGGSEVEVTGLKAGGTYIIVVRGCVPDGPLPRFVSDSTVTAAYDPEFLWVNGTPTDQSGSDDYGLQFSTTSQISAKTTRWVPTGGRPIQPEFIP
jgi:hypothetical protein